MLQRETLYSEYIVSLNKCALESHQPIISCEIPPCFLTLSFAFFFSTFFHPGQWKGVHSLHFLCTTSSAVAMSLCYHKSLYKELQYLCESVMGARKECHQAAVCSFPVTDSQCNPALSKLLRLVLKPLFLNLQFSSWNLECSVMISLLLKIKKKNRKNE